jgi:heat shock protein HtpX
VGQVIKKMGLVLVLCLMTIWLQLVGLLMFTSTSPTRSSAIMLFIMLFAGLLFCLSLGTLTKLLTNKNPSTPIWLQHMATDLADKINGSTPAVHTVNTEGVNAFAVDNMTRCGHIILHQQVLRSLTQDEVEEILAHEICHINKGHAGVLTFVQGAMLPVTLPLALLVSSLLSLVNGVDKFIQTFIKLNSFFSFILFPFTSVILLIANRSWEFQADACAAKLVGKQQYLQTLRCLHGSFFQHPNLLSIVAQAPLKASEQTNSQKAGLTHPSLAQRINALQEIGL